MNQEAVKTNDGHELHINHIYYNSIGEVVSLVDVLTSHDGRLRFLVVPIFEGEAMEAKLYPSGHTEVTTPYIHEAMPVVIEAIYKNEPVPLLGEKMAKATDRLANIAATTGELLRRKKELDDRLKELAGAEEEVRDRIEELGTVIKERDEIIANKTARITEIDGDIKSMEQQLKEKAEQLAYTEQEAVELQNEADELSTKAKSTTMIANSELERLRKAEFKLQCLENGGVDDWVYYDDAMQPWRERYPNG